MFKFAIIVSALILSAYAQVESTTVAPTTTEAPRRTLPPELQEKVCRDLIPLHPGSQGPQNTTAPYTILPAVQRVRNGERIGITIKPTNAGELFNGFMVQARDAADYKTYTIYGTWIVDPEGLNDAQSCISFNDTAFSDSPAAWPQVDLVWEAPLTGSGEVTFFASITKTFTIFWIDLFSQYTVTYGPI